MQLNIYHINKNLHLYNRKGIITHPSLPEIPLKQSDVKMTLNIKV